MLFLQCAFNKTILLASYLAKFYCHLAKQIYVQCNLLTSGEWLHAWPISR